MKKTLALILLATALAGAQEHPLDPLTEAEISTMTRVLSPRLQPGTFFPIVELREPPKAEVLAWKPGMPIRREAFAVVLERKANKVYEAVVDVKNGKELSFQQVEGVQPPILFEEFLAPADLVRSDPRWQAAMQKRGIKPEEFKNIQIDTWAAGLLSPDERATGHRFIRTISHYRPPGNTNPYFRPVEGVIALVDLTDQKVASVLDDEVAPVVKTGGSLEEKDNQPLRPAPKDLFCMQPMGAGFQLRGHEVIWEKWHVRFSMHPREGIVLQDVRYNDNGKLRPVLYRGSLAEMVVPYGDTANAWTWRSAFDLGEYGVGRLGNTLRKGLDVPQYATLIDSVFSDDLGKPYVQPASVAIYERDSGVLWKHFDYEFQHDETRRARCLYLTYIATVGNYDYGLSWILHQDGNISMEANLTGILLPKGTSQKRSLGAASLATGTGTEPVGVERTARLVAPYTAAPNHQHFFNFRLDLDVDGTQNSLVELNNVAPPMGPENPFGNAFIREVKPLSSEAEAQRDMSLEAARTWMVLNPTRLNSLGQSTGFQLLPGENCVPYLHRNAPMKARVDFIDHHLFGSAYRPNQLYPAGYYPNQSTEDTGLRPWLGGNASLVDTDVVLWYTLGINHNPRPEEWPVMSVHKAGFTLAPNGFFSRNPAMDVPSGVPQPSPAR